MVAVMVVAVVVVAVVVTVLGTAVSHTRLLMNRSRPGRTGYDTAERSNM